jgi:outer membrane protein assembly factor BamB
MRRSALGRVVGAAIVVGAGAAFLADGSSAQTRPLEILDPEGKVLEVLGPEGRPRDLAIALAAGHTLPAASSPLTPAPSAVECPTAESRPGYVLRESRRLGLTVDSCGRVGRDRVEGPLRYGLGPWTSAVSAIPVTIDWMTTGPSGSYSPGGTITLLGSADVYHLSDGSSWQSGAGSYRSHWSQLVSVDVDGATIRYVLSPPEVGLLYEQTDYDFGDHSSQGTLGAAGPLVIEAEAGSTTAVLRGEARVVSNDPTWYGEPRFNYFSAIVGSVVPFEVVYTIQGGTWQADTFTKSFSYVGTGTVDFAHPISTPRPVELTIAGPGRVPDEFTTSYRAMVRYEGDVTRDATATSGWTVEPGTLASVAGGVLTVGTLTTPEATLTLRASFVQGSDTVVAEKAIRCLADDPAEKPGSWPMFQANARHTGYLPVSLAPATFRLAWQKALSGLPLNPVAAGEGKVFATVLTYFSDTTHLFALSSRDGATLWSKRFTGEPPGIFSVNPPSFAYGNVYVQTGDHSNDTWLRAFDGTTGEPVFQSPHEAQWERYYAPTLYDGKAYVNGGTYGGMYAFDAYSGARLWYTSLPQYDQWTPAVDADRVYAYVGEYSPGLYVKDRLTGVPAPNFVPDPSFEWDGWSMDLAPVLGAHGDVVAIHDGRLISFDPASATIGWQVQSEFAGQPSIARDRIYAIDGGKLVVLDEVTHAKLWSWTPPSGALAGPMIVTDTHLLASTADATYAVDLVSQQSVWSHPVAGHLALADGMLYIASADGSLTAISTSGAAFYTVTPCRVVDTRRTTGVPVGGPALQGGVPRDLHIGGSCAVPATARAVAVNVTVTEPEAAGNLRLYPGGTLPGTSTVNYSAGQTRANNAIVSLNAAANVTVYASQPTGTSVHLVVDVNGYFE